MRKIFLKLTNIRFTNSNYSLQCKLIFTNQNRTVEFSNNLTVRSPTNTFSPDFKQNRRPVHKGACNRVPSNNTPQNNFLPSQQIPRTHTHTVLAKQLERHTNHR